jgi:hypothetical protein
MASVPPEIMKHIVHPEATAQIKGFQELFVLLNTDPHVDHLRRLVVNYFNDSPWLRTHLREPLVCPVELCARYLRMSCTCDLQDVQALLLPASLGNLPVSPRLVKCGWHTVLIFTFTL